MKPHVKRLKRATPKAQRKGKKRVVARNQQTALPVLPAEFASPVTPVISKEDAEKALRYPTKYDPSFDMELVTFMSGGGSLEDFAALKLVNRNTIKNWRDTHDSFREAFELGDTLSRKWWTTHLAQIAQGLGPRVLKKETVTALMENGVPVIDARGNPLMKVVREYGAASGNLGATCYTMNNKFRDAWQNFPVEQRTPPPTNKALENLSTDKLKQIHEIISGESAKESTTLN